jgi:hypothetical protein
MYYWITWDFISFSWWSVGEERVTNGRKWSLKWMLKFTFDLLLILSLNTLCGTLYGTISTDKIGIQSSLVVELQFLVSFGIIDVSTHVLTKVREF